MEKELIQLEAEWQLAQMSADADPKNEKLKKEAEAKKKAYEAALKPEASKLKGPAKAPKAKEAIAKSEGEGEEEKKS